MCGMCGGGVVCGKRDVCDVDDGGTTRVRDGDGE